LNEYNKNGRIRENLDKDSSDKKEDDYDITISMPFSFGLLLFIKVHIHIFYIELFDSLQCISDFRYHSPHTVMCVFVPNFFLVY